jgi:hypothetical protein
MGSPVRRPRVEEGVLLRTLVAASTIAQGERVGPASLRKFFRGCLF